MALGRRTAWLRFLVNTVELAMGYPLCISNWDIHRLTAIFFATASSLHDRGAGTLLAAPNVVVNVVLIAVTATVDAHFVGRIGPGALAGLSLVFPLIMLMQQMANSSMGGAIASAVARAIGAGRHADASALVVHGVVVGAAMAVIFAAVLLIGGPVIYGLMVGSGSTHAAALEYSNAIFAGAFAYWLLSTLTSVVRGAGPAIVLAVGCIAAEALHG